MSSRRFELPVFDEKRQYFLDFVKRVKTACCISLKYLVSQGSVLEMNLKNNAQDI